MWQPTDDYLIAAHIDSTADQKQCVKNFAAWYPEMSAAEMVPIIARCERSLPQRCRKPR